MGRKLPPITPGSAFGRWVVVDEGESTTGAGPRRERRWVCRCNCGTVRLVGQSSLRNGSSLSCGCRTKELAATRNITHGMTRTPEYRSWGNMKTRCKTPRERDYKYYLGRGITVCEHWAASFEAFYNDMGPQPPGTSLDRIDNDRGYEPGNCRWASATDQSRNTRVTTMVEFDGRRVPLLELAEARGLTINTVKWRLNNGWNLERALNTAPQARAAFGCIQMEFGKHFLSIKGRKIGRFIDRDDAEFVRTLLELAELSPLQRRTSLQPINPCDTIS